MTDVQIAVELLRDAYQDRFDTALLVSADSDLAPPAQAIREGFGAKRIVMVAPPGRRSARLQATVHHHLVLGRRKLALSLLPDPVLKANGFALRCPASWK